MSAEDCEPPHGLDMAWPHDADKVASLEKQFRENGFDKKYPALIGYPLNGKIQLLSGTHRHAASSRSGVKLPVILWLRSDIEASWGELQAWKKVIEDIPVSELETWSREDLYRKGLNQNEC